MKNDKASAAARGFYTLLALCLFACALAAEAWAQGPRGAHAVDGAAPRAAEGALLYSCPMDRDVRSKKPGRCPKCGMDLRPVREEADTPASVPAPASASASASAPASAVNIPDVELLDQDGRSVRFYTDLVKGKVVAVQFIFTTCTTICPPLGATFARVQKELGERAGRDVRFISISVDPATDTPERLKAWGAKFHAAEGWTFVTGAKPQVDELLRSLGALSASPSEHTSSVLVGNERLGQWTRIYGLATPSVLVRVIDDAAAGRLDRPARPPAVKESTR